MPLVYSTLSEQWSLKSAPVIKKFILGAQNLFCGAWIVTWKNILHFETYIRNYSVCNEENEKRLFWGVFI